MKHCMNIFSDSAINKEHKKRGKRLKKTMIATSIILLILVSVCFLLKYTLFSEVVNDIHSNEESSKNDSIYYHHMFGFLRSFLFSNHALIIIIFHLKVTRNLCKLFLGKRGKLSHQKEICQSQYSPRFG